MASHAQIILACERGEEHQYLQKLRCCNQTIGSWLKRFLAKRLEGIFDELYSGVLREITTEEVEKSRDRDLG